MTCANCAAASQEAWSYERRVGDVDLEEEQYEAEFEPEADYEVEPETDSEYDTEYDPETGRRIGDVDFEADAYEQEVEPEIIPPADTRVRVTNTIVAPFRYICNLEYDVPGVGRRSICTGTLIGPRTVLTAGHCLQGLTPARMRVIPGRNATLEPLPATQAVRFVVAPGFRGSSPTDFGVIHLANPIGARMGFWTSRYSRRPGDPVGTSILASGRLPEPAGRLRVHLSGYPADMPNDPRSFCRDPRRPLNRCRHSLLGDRRRSARCGTFPFRAYDLTVRLAGGMLHYLNDTCPGHSGSPVWVRRPPNQGGRCLIGIHVAGDDPAIAGKANRAVFLGSRVLAFIRANIR